MLCKILARIPVEIWLLCWQQVQRAELKTLSLTCHFFRDICLPLLFANLTHKLTAYNHLYWELSSVTTLRSSMNIKRLAASQKLAALPRQWQFSEIGSFKPMQAAFDDSHKLFGISRELCYESMLQGLSAFTGLRAIELNGINIGEDILIALNKLPALEILTCLGTKFSSYSVTPLLRLRELTIASSSPPANNIVSSNSLERLTLSSFSLPSFLENLSNQGPYQYLRHLSLSGAKYPDTQLLFNFLGLCPQLGSLAWEDRSVGNQEIYPDVDFPPLPNSVIPHLKYFSGHGDLAKAIIPGRPVQLVSIARQEELDILNSISESALPISGLRLPSIRPYPMIITAIREYFPYLKFLRLTFDLLCQETLWDILPSHSANSVFIMVPICVKSACGYVGFMESLSINEIPLPSGIQAIEIVCEIGEAISIAQYHVYLIKLAVLYPLLQIAVLGSNQWIKHRDGHWVGVEREDSRLSQFLGEWHLI